MFNMMVRKNDTSVVTLAMLVALAVSPKPLPASAASTAMSQASGASLGAIAYPHSNPSSAPTVRTDSPGSASITLVSSTRQTLATATAPTEQRQNKTWLWWLLLIPVVLLVWWFLRGKQSADESETPYASPQPPDTSNRPTQTGSVTPEVGTEEPAGPPEPSLASRVSSVISADRVSIGTATNPRVLNSVASREAADTSPPSEQSQPPVEPAEPLSPAVESLESAASEPAVSESVASVEGVAPSEPAVSVESVEFVESVEPAASIESAESVTSVDSIGEVDMSEPTESAEGIESAESPEPSALPLQPLAPLSSTPEQIMLAPRDGQQAYIRWPALDEQPTAAQSDRHRYALRLYDVTSLDLKTQPPHSVQQLAIDKQECDRLMPIADYDRDYLAEVGYQTEDESWHPLMRSAVARLSAPDTSGITAPGSAPVAGGVGLTAGLGAAAMSSVSGDRDQSTVEAAKFNVGQSDLSAEALADVDQGLPDLPEGYGDSRIVLLPRDPQWAYAYWDVPNEHKQELRRQGGEILALRLYDVTDIDLTIHPPHNLQQFDCDELARNWYIPIPVSDRDYIVELGYTAADGRWLSLARSAPARIPPVYPSDWFDEQFVTIDWEEPLQGKTFGALIPPRQQTLPTTENPIYDEIFGIAQSTEAQRLAGSLYGSMQMVPEQVVSSYVFPSGVGMWAMPTMSMSGIGMSGIGFSASMPPIRPRKFWLVADAELIVYGATEPDATVTIGDRQIPLNPDGTFRFQMSFQDGFIDYPIVAIAADGEQTRDIHMEFTRETPERRTNTKDEATDEWM